MVFRCMLKREKKNVQSNTKHDGKSEVERELKHNRNSSRSYISRHLQKHIFNKMKHLHCELKKEEEQKIIYNSFHWRNGSGKINFFLFFFYFFNFSSSSFSFSFIFFRLVSSVFYFLFFSIFTWNLPALNLLLKICLSFPQLLWHSFSAQ